MYTIKKIALGNNFGAKHENSNITINVNINLSPVTKSLSNATNVLSNMVVNELNCKQARPVTMIPYLHRI